VKLWRHGDAAHHGCEAEAALAIGAWLHGTGHQRPEYPKPPMRMHQGARQMKVLELSRCALCVSIAAAILAGCGGSQPPLGSPGSIPQNRIILHGLSPSSYKVLHRFSLRGRAPSALPITGLVNVNGTLYGTTRGNFKTGNGTVYSISAAGEYKLLHVFNGSDGSNPFGTLIDVNGTLYGTTYQGGSFGQGVVFSITTSGAEKVLHNFKAGLDGTEPQGALIYLKGTLYGTTYQGGSYGCNCGTVYSISTTGTEKVLHSFQGSYDGSGPVAGLTDVNGRLYGTASGGGSSGGGTFYRVSTAGSLNVLYSFRGGPDASYPAAALIDVNGMLYGTTREGGSSKIGSTGHGTVYSVSTRGSEKVLYSFCPKRPNCSDGWLPLAALINLNGTLYGTTYMGGASGCGCGVVYSVTLGGSEKVLHRFTSGKDGAKPLAEFVDVNGTLYSTTTFGGGAGGSGCYGGCGTVFAFTP
jgi:uncharacterized repeat protein (TIGR03803 family)